ncbi:MAG: hypothetical protein V1816_04405 [Pseudomonadota bacterium]
MKKYNRYFALMLFLLVFSTLALPVGAQDEDPLQTALQRARTAGVDEEEIDRLLVLGLDNQLTSAQTADFIGRLTVLTGDGLPLRPFVNKIGEGLAKKVPPRLILSALERKRDDYLFVAGELARTGSRWGDSRDFSTVDAGSSLAELLSSGVSREELSAYLDRIPMSDWNSLLGSVEFLAVLKQAGLDPALSSDLAFNGLVNGYFAEGNLGLALAAAAARKKGKNPEEIGLTLARGVTTKKTVNELCLALGLTPAEALVATKPKTWPGTPLNARPKVAVEPAYNALSPGSSGPGSSSSGGGGESSSGSGQGRGGRF